MRVSSLRLGVLLSAVAIGGCGVLHRGSNPSTQIDASAADRRFDWKASLFTPSELAGAMQVRGTAQWSRDGDRGSTASITIQNATPGGVHPWHVHQGRCGSNGPIVGSAAAYKPLTVNNQGTASAVASLGMSLPDSGEYYVNVHASSSNLGTIIACGNLAPPVS